MWIAHLVEIERCSIDAATGSYVMDVMAYFLTVVIGPVVVSYLVCHLILCRMSWLV